MASRSELGRAWNVVHQVEPISEQPDAEAVAFLEFVGSQSAKGASILDAGCGRGRNTLHLSRLGYTVHACDLSPVALRIARARAVEAGTSVHFQACDLTRLPYANGFFAVAICVHVLPYHLRADIVESVRELWRVLKPNGWLYLDLLACEDAEYGRGQNLEENTFLDPDGTPLHFSSGQEVRELLAGFGQEQITRLELASSPDRIRVAWIAWARKQPGAYEGT